jgi:hypothetical protein
LIGDVMENPGQQIPTVFDADNHYWETGDAFTRHRDPAFAERGVRLVDVDGSGKPATGSTAAGCTRSSRAPVTFTPGPAPARSTTTPPARATGPGSATSCRARTRPSTLSGTTAMPACG